MQSLLLRPASPSIPSRTLACGEHTSGAYGCDARALSPVLKSRTTTIMADSAVAPPALATQGVCGGSSVGDDTNAYAGRAQDVLRLTGGPTSQNPSHSPTQSMYPTHASADACTLTKPVHYPGLHSSLDNRCPSPI